MGFRKDSWATIWSIEEGRGNTAKVRISISKRKKDSTEYEQDFSGFCTFIGAAKEKVDKLQPNSKIKLGDVDVSTYYNKESKKEYVTYKVFDFETLSGDGTTTPPAKNTTAKKSSGLEDSGEEGDVDEDTLPF